ncbi:hypothetical protein TNCV_3147201 [Trichonephila clavipes]|nr:hypothetical protein TNCV_3147201 [Trichonephila clavipes]
MEQKLPPTKSTLFQTNDNVRITPNINPSPPPTKSAPIPRTKEKNARSTNILHLILVTFTADNSATSSSSGFVRKDGVVRPEGWGKSFIFQELVTQDDSCYSAVAPPLSVPRKEVVMEKG